MESFIQDIRYGFRTLAKKPGFTIVAAVTIAPGIGANTALFSVGNGVLLKSLPFKDPDRVVLVLETNAKLPGPGTSASALNYRDWKEQSHSFEVLSARQHSTANLTTPDQPEKIQGEKATWEYLNTLGVATIAGRTFTTEEDRPGAAPVILLSKGLWQRRFGGDPKIIGQTIPINGLNATVLGIMPNDYRPNLEFWMPLGISYENADRGLHNIQVVGRLAVNVTLESAQTEMKGIAARLASEYPDFNTGWNVVLFPYQNLITFNWSGRVVAHRTVAVPDHAAFRGRVFRLPTICVKKQQVTQRKCSNYTLCSRFTRTFL